MLGSSNDTPASGGAKQTGVVLGQFDPLIGIGLVHVLGLERSLRIIDHGLGEMELERAIRAHKPEVVILDAPSVANLGRLTHFRTAHPTIGIVVLARRPRGVEIGATFLSTKASPEDVLLAVQKAAEDGRALASRRADHEGEELPLRDPQALTAREEEVREALRSHEPIKVLAAKHHMSPSTFKRHARSVRRKLGVPTRWYLADPGPHQQEAEVQ